MKAESGKATELWAVQSTPKTNADQVVFYFGVLLEQRLSMVLNTSEVASDKSAIRPGLMPENQFLLARRTPESSGFP
jgi:hypothetical protein